jgi:signal transduction histidine kinase
MSPSSSRIELIQLFKQVATDQSSSERRKFDPGELARQVLTGLRSGQHKNLALDLGCEPGLVITSYPASYGQVLSNLFANSVIHAFSDGRPGTVGVKVRTAGEHEVEILFSDDGCGMSSDIRCQAFNPFFTTHRDRGCHGLGLHIVHNVVTHRLGGRIDLRSGPGEGTTVRLVLPRTAPGLGMSAVAPPSGPP